MVGRTEGPCLGTFRPKIFRLKLENNQSIYRNIIYNITKCFDLRKMLRKHATNGNTSKNVLLRILRGTFKTCFFCNL